MQVGRLYNVMEEFEQLSAKELLGNVSLAAVKALDVYNEWREEYAMATQDGGWDDQMEMWEQIKYDWFLGESLDEVDNLVDDGAVDTMLVELYKVMDKAVKVSDLIIEGQTSYNEEFMDNFTTSGLRLKAVLLEVSLALRELQINYEEDQWSIPEEVTNQEDGTMRNLRDLLLLRDIIHLLEWSHKICTSMTSNL